MIVRNSYSHTFDMSRFLDPSLKVMFMTDLKWFKPLHRGILSNLRYN